MGDAIKNMSAAQVLDQFFLDTRCRLLDVAATLDRITRGVDAAKIADDPRMKKIQQAIQILQLQPQDRAEAIQQLFSLEYDPSWPIPQPRY